MYDLGAPTSANYAAVDIFLPWLVDIDSQL